MSEERITRLEERIARAEERIARLEDENKTLREKVEKTGKKQEGARADIPKGEFVLPSREKVDDLLERLEKFKKKDGEK